MRPSCRALLVGSVTLTGLVLISPTLMAEGPETTIDLRYRLEGVEQDGFDKDALASTVRLRLGIETPDWHGLDAGLMFHGNRVIGNRLYADSVTPTNRPVVADPADTGISQAWLRYRAGDSFQTRIGRQRIIDDNARFIGNVGFRQLEQTFDAATLEWTPGDAWSVNLQYLDRAHRIFGTSHPNPLMAEADLDSWVGIVSRSFGETTAGVYAHRFEYEDRPASHENLGLRLHGPLPGDTGFTYRLEYATQSGIDGRGPADSQDYMHLKVSQQLEGWRWFLGHERLSGDGQDSFQTPFATLHAHNGWADRFLTTPTVGLQDTWVGVATRIGAWQFLVKLHDFSADSGSQGLGQEIDLSLGRALSGPWRTQLKLAAYSGDTSQPDVNKVWWTVGASW